MNITLAEIADYALVAANSGNLSVIGMFNAIHAKQLPAVHPIMHLALRIEGSAVEGGRSSDLEIRCMDPDGKTVYKHTDSFSLPVVSPAAGTTAKHVYLLRINNLKFSTYGGHTFSVFINGDLKTEILFRVLQRQQ